MGKPARKQATTGTAGITHCGRWTPNDGAERWGPSRFVCLQPAGHNGPHYGGVSEWTWTDDDRTPRKAGQGQPAATGGEAR